MPNLPTITPTEIAVAGAAVALLYLAPFLLGQIESHRRRRLARRHAALCVGEAAPSPATAAADFGQPSGTAAPMPVEYPEEHVHITTEAEPALAERPANAAAAPIEPDLRQPVQENARPAEPEASDDRAEMCCVGTELAIARPFDGSAGHRFRLEDLHRARLTDWPPHAISDDAGRRQLWAEAERLAETHRAAVFSPVLISPCAVRSVCLGAVEKEGPRFRLHFLLFPGLWAVSRDQAVAQAVFEIDSVTGEVRQGVGA